jgi:hypothetical protein
MSTLNQKFLAFVDTLDHLEVLRITISPAGEFSVPSEKDGKIAQVSPSTRKALGRFLRELADRLECPDVKHIKRIRRAAAQNVKSKSKWADLAERLAQLKDGESIIIECDGNLTQEATKIRHGLDRLVACSLIRRTIRIVDRTIVINADGDLAPLDFSAAQAGPELPAIKANKSIATRVLA